MAGMRKCEGYRVIEAADGREGVRLYREHRPGLVIADIVMPEKDGIETVKEILGIDPAAVIFIMSGKAGAEENIEVARMLGAKRGFQKPIRMDTLLGAIHDHLRPPTPKHRKVYEQGFKVTVHETGILIEAVDYHTKPLFLDAEALAEIGLKMHEDDERVRKD